MRAAMGTGRLIAGRYRLQDPIGRGAMGVVWRGRDELLHRDVAVKEVLVTAGQAPGDSRRTIGEASYQRTLREARAAARLSHPGVVTVFDILDESGSPWIVMELIRGRSLDQVIAEDGPLPPRHAARIGASLVSALAAAHAAGVLHRDVKPANVLVTAEGRVVLTDFGIAKIGADPGQTQLGMVLGTPGFTAPERVRGEAATPASDLWSLGATLYAAVEGRGPFDRPGGVAAICDGITREEPPRAPSAGALAPVIDALLRRDPAARPDAAATAALLGGAAAEPGAPLTAPPGAGSGGTVPAAYASAPYPPAPYPAAPYPAAPYLPAGSRPGPGAAPAPAAGGLDSPADPALAGTVALPAPPPGGPPGPAGFLDPPAFDQLSMPPPPPGQPLPPGAPGSREPGLPAFLGPATGPPAGRRPAAGPPGRRRPAAGPPPSGAPSPQPGSRPAPPPGPPRPGHLRPGQPRPGQPRPGQPRAGQPPGGPPPRRGSWRLVAVGASIAVIVLAALVGLRIYDRTLTAVPDSAAAASPAPAGTGTSAPAGTADSGTPGAGGAAGAGPPPAGYAWHTATAARLGTTAGFVIAVPERWRAGVQGQAVVLEPPAGGGGIEVSLAPFTAAQPTGQARREQAAAIAGGRYPGYRLTAIEPAQFRGRAAAAWRFTWRSGALSRTTVLTLLVTLPTSAGVQPYALSVSAPTLDFPAARRAFDTALTTFAPLPG